MYKVVLVGAGSICRTHVDAFEGQNGRAKVVGIVSLDLSLADKVIEEKGLDARSYEDYKEAIEKENPDIVSVITPPGAHKEVVLYALNAGKHVVVEKPMAPSLKDCDEMIECAKKNGKVLSAVAQSRFINANYKTKKLLDSGICGKLLFTQVNSFWYRGNSYYSLAWRGTWASEGGGCTLIHAIHHVDLLHWFTGMPKTVTAVIGNLAHDNSEEEDISMAIFGYEDGSMSQMTSTLVCHGQKQELLMVGEKASIAVPTEFQADVPLENGFPEQNTELLQQLQEAYDAIPDLEYQEHAGVVNDMLNAIDEGRADVLLDGVQGRRTLELVMAIYKSAATGQTVTLPLAPDDPFYTKEGLVASMPHFHEKTVSVDKFEKDDIVLASSNMVKK
ncbi:MAG: Gfo/Idh/MocA family oxidoreductase [Lachnospiraceae bacterium]|nr:Gfo/Idh/MocA family oxidoreductase [Lachnospiraceae bacterium]